MGDRGHTGWDEALRSGKARDFWRSIDELLDSPEFRARLAPEFSEGADGPALVSRRDLMRLAGATAAMAGLAGCMQEPRTPIVPYVREPEGRRPGQVLHYATMHSIDGFAEGLLVKARDGRPLKIDGSPEHPATLGGSSIHQQALLYELYDPQRAQVPTHRGRPRPYAEFTESFARAVAGGGDGLRFLLEPTTSPSLIELLERLALRFPRSKTYFHSVSNSESMLEGLRRSTGRSFLPRFDFTPARVVVSFGADFLGQFPFGIRYSRQFADGRRLFGDFGAMNRLYVIETDLSVTGMAADHRLARKPSRVRDAALALLAALARKAQGLWPEPAGRLLVQARTDEDPRWVEALAVDLLRQRGQSVVLAGPGQPPDVHSAVHAMNDVLANVGQTVSYSPSPIHRAGDFAQDLAALADEARAGAVDHLVIVGGNPACAAPADLRMRDVIRAVPHTAYCGLYADETARLCEWFIPASHPLERWDDARAVDGTLTFGQPLIEPLYDSRAPAEFLSAFAGEAKADSHSILRTCWAGRSPLDAPGTWEKAIQHGFVEGTAFPTERPATRWDEIARLISGWKLGGASEGEYEIFFRPDLKILDGRFSNNQWLLELADPVTKLTWDNAALVSPRTAADLGLDLGTCVRVARDGANVTLPVIVLPGHADGAITLPFGFGAGAKAWDGDWYADAIGVDVYPLWRTIDRRLPAAGTIERLSTTGVLALTQDHWSMEGRPIAITRTLDEFRSRPAARATDEHIYSLYGPFDASFPEQWGMAIDLTVCTGCSACVAACQAENNIPVVGKVGVGKSREMHWIRIDRYFTGGADSPGAVVQPMLCQHCESAPCEYVCPVNATTHSPDGLNEMTYNRCVGTRFCQNNCPYKVRRFNWFDFNIRKPPTLRMMMNPDVTVRARGVIEKCTYCVQRIREAQIATQKENRLIRDGEVRTACQEACPTGAIVFGNIKDKDAQVSRWMRHPRTYQVLEELGTRPRTRYLTRITNPNPELI